LIQILAHNIRDWADGKHRITDDAPYGGGPGMVMKAEPIIHAIEAFQTPESRVLVMTPQGRRFTQADARRLAAERHLILVCGHYEGLDHRVIEITKAEELSIGDYVLTNGAIAAAVVTDAVSRLIPGVLGDEHSATEESFSGAGLEAPQYTRPVEIRGHRVPDVLISGDHGAIALWRRAQGRLRTSENRPDLIGE
jgi:tRNA (guanine37-N1)-methyltransferase